MCSRHVHCSYVSVFDKGTVLLEDPALLGFWLSYKALTSKERNMKKIIIAIFCLSISATTLAQTQPGEYPTPYPLQPEISVGELWPALRNEGWWYATKLTGDLALQEAFKFAAKDPEKAAQAIGKAIEAVKNLLADPNKTQAEKVDLLMQMIEKSMIKYKSAPAGQLSLALQHSLEYGVTRLDWKPKIEVDKCKTWYWKTTYYECDSPSGTCSQQEHIYKEDFYKKTPDHYIYRIIAGQEQQVAEIKGGVSVSSRTLSTDLGFSFTDFKQVYEFFTFDDANVDANNAVYYDFFSSLNNQNKNKSISYKVKSDNSPYKPGNCGSSEAYTSTAVHDGNGDGVVDYIPESEYTTFYNSVSWLVPIVSNLLN